VQSEVFMPAGKTTDVMINVPATGATALPIFDRQLSLIGQFDRARRRHARLHQHQWRTTAFDRRVQHGVDDGGGQSGYVTTP